MNKHFDPNEGLYRKLADMERRLDGLLRARRPYIADWNEVAVRINSTSNVLTFFDFGIDLRNFFNKGDKIRAKQGGGWIYSYVVETNVNSIRVFGGDDYNFVDGDVTDFGFTRNATANGFPPNFLFAPEVGAVAPMTVDNSTIDINNGRFFMVASTMFYSGRIMGLTVGGTGTNQFRVELPVQPNPDSSVAFYNAPLVAGFDDMFVTVAGQFIDDAVVFDGKELVITNLGGAWTSPSSDSGFDFNIFYEI